MTFRFGQIRFDLNRRQLLREGREYPLQPKALDLLRVLIEARPRVLNKAEIMDLVWPDSYVAEANVAILIGEIRAALADSARQPQFIRTHFGIGYSFIGDVTELTRFAATSHAGPLFVLSLGLRKIALLQGDTSVGRDPSSDIMIPDPSVSRQHARISVDRQHASVEDLNSKNGTRLNGERIQESAAVCHSAEIYFGSVRTTIEMAGATELSTLTIEDIASECKRG
jgi:DNA-binding winged helix-turn-helix (wHTH) protein